MAGKRLPDHLRRFGCRNPHRIDRTRRRPAFGERVCPRQRCRADRRDGQDRSISHFLASPIGFHVTSTVDLRVLSPHHSRIRNSRCVVRGYTGRDGFGTGVCAKQPIRNLSQGGEPPLRVAVAPSTAICSDLPTRIAPGHSRVMTTKSRESIYGSSVRAAAERATEARKEADRLACEAWNKRMLGFQGPAQPSPALGDALNAEMARRPRCQSENKLRSAQI